MCSFVMETPDNPKKHPGIGNKVKTPPFTVSSLVNAGSEKKTGVTCTYCGQPHPSARCTVITDTAAKGWCFQCLQSNHIIKNCPSEKRCFKCNQRHHISICPKLLPLQTPPTKEENPKPEKDEKKNESGAALPSTTNVACTSSNQPKTVLLQTESAMISNVENRETQIKVRILFDLGSQRSYLSETLQEKLDL